MTHLTASELIGGEEGENEREKEGRCERPRESEKQSRDMGPMLVLTKGGPALLPDLCPSFQRDAPPVAGEDQECL